MYLNIRGHSVNSEIRCVSAIAYLLAECWCCLCIIDQLHHICNDIWMKETIPDDWTKSIILTMPKKGDVQV